MTALPDTYMPEGPLRHQRQVPLHHHDIEETGAMRQVGGRVAALSLLLAAVGLWLVPVIEGDAMMQLFKLAFSAVLAMVGVVLLGGRSGPVGPEVHIDPQTRRMTVIERDDRGRLNSEVSHDIDALADIVLRDGLLTARCSAHETIVTLPVTSPQVEAALLKVLGTRAP